MFDSNFWKNKKVLITGHSGFKGSWLSLLLKSLGAKVYGISLAPETKPALFDQIKLSDKIEFSFFIDINDKSNLNKKIIEIRPEIVFHLAAQPLVRQSYLNPIETWKTNLMGSLNLLESLTNLNSLCAVVMITTDKVYKNREWDYGYRENDELGGYDPYSASKAACEIAISSWRSSFCNAEYNKKEKLAIASARAGNVIGGGDWAKDRIIPDLIKSFSNNKNILIRNPNSTRPWQHVLDPISGYLILAEKLFKTQKEQGEILENNYATSFNFGPNTDSNKTVLELVKEISKYWEGAWSINESDDGFHEASKLSLQIDKSCKFLKWHPKWDFHESVERTVKWYKKVNSDERLAYRTCLEDIDLYMQK